MKHIITVVLLFLFFSCENSTHQTEEHLSDVDRAAKLLAAKGYDVKGYASYTPSIDQSKTYLVLQGDAMFDVEDILNPKPTERKKQYSTTHLLSSSQVENIRVAFHSNVPSWWKTVTRQSLNNWETITGTKVNFTEVSYSSGNYDIRVFVDDLGAPTPNGVTLARSTFPLSNGDAGRDVIINTHVLNSTSESRAIFTMTHEFGHSLGFRHTNWFDRNSDGYSDKNDPYDYEGISQYGAEHIDGTPTGLDEASIMKATVLDWNGFSTYDEIALRALYPDGTTTPPATGISGPDEVANNAYGTFTAPAGSSYVWYYNIGFGWEAFSSRQTVSFQYDGYISLAVVVDGEVYTKYNILFY